MDPSEAPRRFPETRYSIVRELSEGDSERRDRAFSNLVEACRVDLVDARADVYALGVMLKELVDGADEAVPRRLEAIADKALSQELAGRYAGVPELTGDVANFLDGEPVSAYREGLVEIVTRWFERYRARPLLRFGLVLAETLRES